MKCQFSSSILRIALRVATEEWGAWGAARITGGSWSTVTVNVLAVVASDETVGSLAVTGHQAFLGARTDVLAVEGGGWHCRDSRDE